MDTIQAAKRVVMIVFVFIVATQAFYTFRNLATFEFQYEKLNDEQAVDIGKEIKNYFSIPIELQIPIERIGGVEKYLNEVLTSNPSITSIEIVSQDKVLFSAGTSLNYKKIITLPISDIGSNEIAQIRLSVIDQNVKEGVRTLLIDLVSVIIACLVYTYELLIFIASFVIVLPGYNMIHGLNIRIATLSSIKTKTNSKEFDSVLDEMDRHITPIRYILNHFLYALQKLALFVSTKSNSAKELILKRIDENISEIKQIIKNNEISPAKRFPSHVRPIVATFILSANLQSSFLPVYTKELLETPTFIDAFFAKEILVGLPITLYMIVVAVALMSLGSSYCSKFKPFKALTWGLIISSAGFILSAFALNVIHLILGRMMCAIGFAMIVFYCRNYIVEHSDPENRALNLAGYTAAFSGGMLCSIVVGGIITEYFSYKAVFLFSAAILLIVLKFAHMVFKDYGSDENDLEDAATESLSVKSNDKNSKAVERKNIPLLFKLMLKDIELASIFFQGIVTRVIFIGLFYYTLPIFLKQFFSFSDVGRIMMFYTLSSILLSTWLNKFVKQPKHSIWGIFISNVVLGVAMCLFTMLKLDNTIYIGLVSIGLLLILGIANCITFPSQVNLLLETKTAKQMGTHTPMAVFQAVERVGSALGPVIFGSITVWFEITDAVGVVGAACLVTTIMFIIPYSKRLLKN